MADTRVETIKVDTWRSIL